MILTDEQVMTRDMTRAFAREVLAPGAAERDRTSAFPGDALRAMAELGLMGMLVPEEYGGAASDYVSYVAAIEEIAAGDGACSTIMSVHNSVVCGPILAFGTDAQKQRFLPRLASGEWLGAFCLTESQAGSDASSLRTRARRDGKDYVIDGSKQFITSGANAQVAIVFAVTDPQAGKKGITAFIVPTDTQGFRVDRLEKKLGQKSSDLAQLSFESMRVPADLRLGAEGEGYRIALSNLESGRIGIAAQAVGMARAAVEAAIAYGRDRTTFGVPIVEHQGIGFSIADMATRVEAARQLVLHAACRRKAGLPCLKEASMAKLFASEIAEQVCSAAIQVHGGYGYTEDFPVERLFRDVRACRIYEGTSEIQRLVISREVLRNGLD